MLGKRDVFSLRASLRFILFSTLVISGIPALIWYSYQNHQKSLEDNPAYQLNALIQTGPQKEALPSAFFAEFLDLSVDKPKNLARFELKEAVNKLGSLPFIKACELKKIYPDTLYIDYTLRQPFVRLADFSNTVIDEEGSIFPLVPYYAPQHLPEVYLGLFEDKEVNLEVDPKQFIERQHLSYILKLLKALKKREIKASFIDLSQAFESSLGKRELVVEIEDGLIQEGEDKLYKESFPKLLRLDPREFEQNLDDYLSIIPITRQEAKKNQIKKAGLHHPLVVVDFRVEDLAFLSFPKGHFLSSDRKLLKVSR